MNSGLSIEPTMSYTSKAALNERTRRKRETMSCGDKRHIPGETVHGTPSAGQ